MKLTKCGFCLLLVDPFCLPPEFYLLFMKILKKKYLREHTGILRQIKCKVRVGGFQSFFYKLQKNAIRVHCTLASLYWDTSVFFFQQLPPRDQNNLCFFPEFSMSQVPTATLGTATQLRVCSTIMFVLNPLQPSSKNVEIETCWKIDDFCLLLSFSHAHIQPSSV